MSSFCFEVHSNLRDSEISFNTKVWTARYVNVWLIPRDNLSFLFKYENMFDAQPQKFSQGQDKAQSRVRTTTDLSR